MEERTVHVPDPLGSGNEQATNLESSGTEAQDETVATGADSSLVSPRFGAGFRRLWATFGVASFGDGFISGAVPLLAAVIDPRPIAVAGVVAADSVPWLALALHAGAIADRFQRSRVMAVTNLIRGVLLGVMAALVAAGTIGYLGLVLFVLANASARAIYYSASQAAMTELVDASGFNRANGVLYGTEAATEDLAGPSLGTIAFAASRALPFATDAIAMIASGLSLFGLHTRRPDPDEEKPNLSDGLRLILGNKSLRLLVVLIAALVGLQGLVSGVLVLVATREWGVAQGAYGAFIASQAAGIMCGGFIADRVARKLGSVPTLITTAGLSGIAYLVMGLAGGWALAGAAFIFVGLSIGIGSVVAVSLRQRLTPNALMGRVGSAWRGVAWAAAPVGALVGGAIASAAGLRTPLFIAGGLQLVVALVLARPLRRRLGSVDAEQRLATPPAGSSPAQA